MARAQIVGEPEVELMMSVPDAKHLFDLLNLTPVEYAENGNETFREGAYSRIQGALKDALAALQ